MEGKEYVTKYSLNKDMHYSGPFFCLSLHRPRRATGVFRHIHKNQHCISLLPGFPLLRGPHCCCSSSQQGKTQGEKLRQLWMFARYQKSKKWAGNTNSMQRLVTDEFPRSGTKVQKSLNFDCKLQARSIKSWFCQSKVKTQKPGLSSKLIVPLFPVIARNIMQLFHSLLRFIEISGA